MMMILQVTSVSNCLIWSIFLFLQFWAATYEKVAVDCHHCHNSINTQISDRHVKENLGNSRLGPKKATTPTLFLPLRLISRHKVSCSSVSSCLLSRSLNCRRNENEESGKPSEMNEKMLLVTLRGLVIRVIAHGSDCNSTVQTVPPMIICLYMEFKVFVAF